MRREGNDIGRPHRLLEVLDRAGIWVLANQRLGVLVVHRADADLPEAPTRPAEPDLGDQLPKAQAAVRRGARPAGVPVDNGYRGGIPAELDRPPPERIPARPRLGVALQLRRRRLAHIDDRPAAPVPVGDLLAVTQVLSDVLCEVGVTDQACAAGSGSTRSL
jgi:hypothetical protein